MQITDKFQYCLVQVGSLAFLEQMVSSDTSSSILIPTQDPSCDLACRCMKVRTETIQVEMEQGRVRDMQSLIQVTGACSGCGACACSLKQILSKKEPKSSGPCSYCYECRTIRQLCSCS